VSRANQSLSFSISIWNFQPKILNLNKISRGVGYIYKTYTPSEIASQLPLGHSLYTDYVEKIISIPNAESMLGLFPTN